MDTIQSIIANVNSTEKLEITTESGKTLSGRVPNEPDGMGVPFRTTYDGTMGNYSICEKGGTVVMLDVLNNKVLENVTDVNFAASAL